jgi:hexokinase
MEWCAYDDKEVLPLTQFDKMLDEASTNPGQQLFEKMVAGLYMGEICRYYITI